MPSKDDGWFLKTDTSRYKGEYVIILEQKIVAHGKNAKTLLEKVSKKFPRKTPTLAKIPKDDVLIL